MTFFYMLHFGLTRNKDSAILRPKIDKRNKRTPLALDNSIKLGHLRYFLLFDNSNIMSS